MPGAHKGKERATRVYVWVQCKYKTLVLYNGSHIWKPDVNSDVAWLTLSLAARPLRRYHACAGTAWWRRRGLAARLDSPWSLTPIILLISWHGEEAELLRAKHVRLEKRTPARSTGGVRRRLEDEDAPCCASSWSWGCGFTFETGYSEEHDGVQVCQNCRSDNKKEAAECWWSRGTWATCTYVLKSHDEHTSNHNGVPRKLLFTWNAVARFFPLCAPANVYRVVRKCQSEMALACGQILDQSEK